MISSSLFNLPCLRVCHSLAKRKLSFLYILFNFFAELLFKKICLYIYIFFVFNFTHFYLPCYYLPLFVCVNCAIFAIRTCNRVSI